MPLEIREVVIKAQLERASWSEQSSSKDPLSEQDLQAIKEEILAYCLEKIEERRDKREQSDRLWL